MRPSILMCFAVTLAAGLAASPGESRPPQTPSSGARMLDEVIRAETEFAKDSVDHAVKKSFLRWVAPDGVIFRPRPVPAPETLAKDPDDDPSEGFLDWWPVVAGASRAGDLGFSVGPWYQHLTKPPASYPADVYGYYCTIWRRQADGTLKFVIDGAGAFLRTTPPTRAKGSPVIRMPVPAAKAGANAKDATAQVMALEDKLAAGLLTDARSALPNYYYSGAWVMGSHVEVMPGRAGWIAELARRPARMRLTYGGGGASGSGDLVYTYGNVESLDPKFPYRDATYLHIWMLQQGRWRIVFDGIKQRRSFD